MRQSRRSSAPADSASGKNSFFPAKRKLRRLLSESKKIVAVSTPLSLNRMLICVLQGIEAALLPQQLVRFGLSSPGALSTYGTLTGMAMPLLLFPTAITGALGTLLLPAVSEARVLDQKRQLSRTIEAAFRVSLLLGIFCFHVFCLFGKDVGILLFHSATAGLFIRRLAWLCPFFYLNTTLVSVLHGLGKTFAVSLQNSIGFAVRLASVLFLVPARGIEGYFLGLFLSQFLIFAAMLATLCSGAPLHLSVFSVFLKPLAACSVSACGLLLLQKALPLRQAGPWCSFLLRAFLYLGFFALLYFRSLSGSIFAKVFPLRHGKKTA